MAADALGTPAPAATPTVGVVSDEDHRLAMAAMIAPQSSTLAVRTGVMWGPNTTALVTGTSATGTMTYAIAVHHAVTTRGTADGIYLGPTLDAATTVTTTAAPGSNSRIDIIWAKQNDTSSTISVDSGSTAPLYGVANGTAAVSPVAPSIPVGAIELARVTVAVGATSTNGAGVTITNTAQQTVARGADIPVRSQTERDAFSPFWPLASFKRLDTGNIEVRNAANTAWQTLLSDATSYTPTLLTPATGWTQSSNYQKLHVVKQGTEVRIRGTVENTVAVTNPTTSLVVAAGGIPSGSRPAATVQRNVSVTFGLQAPSVPPQRVNVYTDGGMEIVSTVAGGSGLSWSFDFSYTTLAV